ncbi:MAG: hypothetical protein R3E91_01325 [Chlamydiales bacterium]
MELVFSGFNQHFLYKGEPFFSRIYSGEGELPKGFNVQEIVLDASENSSLKWQFQIKDALVLWRLDFALDIAILSDEPRYLALELALDHFLKTVWPRFEESTFGIALYKGPFLPPIISIIKRLASHLPENLLSFIFLDTEGIADLQTYFRSLNQFALGFFIPVLKGKWSKMYPYAFPALAWDHVYSPMGYSSEVLLSSFPEKRLSTGVMIPKYGSFPLPEETFRIIPEEILTEEWEGLDRLIVSSSAMTEEAQRKLHGFVAAGGEVIYL